MPQTQQIEIAANQQGSALSYLIGVMMGDGCVICRKGRMKFHLKTIDGDFADFVERKFQEAFPGAKINRSIQAQHRNAYGKKPLHYLDVNGEAAQMLAELTHHKTIVPAIVYEHRRPFLEGFLDSDGWVNVNHDTKTGTIRLQIGVAKGGGYLHSIKKLFEEEGVKTQKIQVVRTKSGKAIHRIRFNPQSFLNSGLRFHIQRKQNRLDAYMAAVEKIGRQRVRATFNDYKGELLKAAEPYRSAAKV